jgi:hypothetical protein
MGKKHAPIAGVQYGEIAGMKYEVKMKIEKYHVGMVLAIICLAILVAAFFLPWWVIEREERTPTEDPIIYANSSHEFKLLGISTTHKDLILNESRDERFETAYSDIDGSELDTHFLMLTLLMALAVAFLVVLLFLYHFSRVKSKLRLAALILGFAAIFVILGSAAYMHQTIPQEVGNSRDHIEEVLGYGYVAGLPEIQTLAGTDFNQTAQGTSETVWGPSLAWYSTFAVCIIMIFSIMLLETKPEEEDS